MGRAPLQSLQFMMGKKGSGAGEVVISKWERRGRGDVGIGREYSPSYSFLEKGGQPS